MNASGVALLTIDLKGNHFETKTEMLPPQQLSVVGITLKRVSCRDLFSKCSRASNLGPPVELIEAIRVEKFVCRNVPPPVPGTIQFY